MRLGRVDPRVLPLACSPAFVLMSAIERANGLNGAPAAIIADRVVGSLVKGARGLELPENYSPF